MRYSEREWRLVAATVVLAVVAAALLAVYLLPDRADTPAGSMQTGLVPASVAPAAAPSRPVGAPTVKAGYFLRSSWKGGFNAELVVTNLDSQALEGWTVRLQMADDVRLTQAWSAESKQVAAGVILSSQPWNTYLAPGASVHFGFAATGTAAAPRSCTVNGTPC